LGVRIIKVAETIVRSSSPIAVGLGKGLQPLSAATRNVFLR
jgi:hypothetical protein